MKYRVWYSTESFADYIIDKTALKTKSVTKRKMYESDANNAKNFHSLPDHIKQILYLKYHDATKAPNLRTKGLKFDSNHNFAGSPDSSHSEMVLMFKAINEIISVIEQSGVIEGRKKLLGKIVISDRESLMQQEYADKGGNDNMSPLTATGIVPTKYLLNRLSAHENSNYKIGELLRGRAETVIYKVDAAFRGDPYPGALAAIDYLRCREGKSFEERKYNLVMCWGDLTVDHKNKTLIIKSKKSTINDFASAVKASEDKNLLTKKYSDISSSEIPRYYMQVRYGSMFSKVKHVRVFSYFADAILFPDGALWRDA